MGRQSAQAKVDWLKARRDYHRSMVEVAELHWTSAQRLYELEKARLAVEAELAYTASLEQLPPDDARRELALAGRGMVRYRSHRFREAASRAASSARRPWPSGRASWPAWSAPACPSSGR